jgi:hypothetical protein
MQAAQARGFETVVDIKVFLDGEKINVPLTVSIPYTRKPNENPAAVRVWYMCGNGTLTCMNGVYADGFVTFTVPRQSYFVVGYDPVLLWENIFNDLPEDDPFYEAIAFMNMLGLINGHANGTAGSAEPFTRAQAAALLWNLEDKPLLTTNNGQFTAFSDVDEDHWYYDAVMWAAENNVAAGKGGGLFDPGTAITRQETAQMLYNYAVNFKGYEIPENRSMPEYTDKDQIGVWAESAAKALAEAGVLPPDDEFRPKDGATRGEAAKLFRNFLRFVAADN